MVLLGGHAPLHACVGLTRGFVYSGGLQGPLCGFAFQLCVDVQFVFSLVLLVCFAAPTSPSPVCIGEYLGQVSLWVGKYFH